MRLFEDKFYFTIVDFVGASANFSDPEWDGEPIPEDPPRPTDPPGEDEIDPPEPPGEDEIDPPPPRQKIIIKLAEGKELSIKSMSTSMFYFHGIPVSAEEFIKRLFNTITLPQVLKSEEELRQLWSSPITRNELLKKLEDNGFTRQDLKSIQTLIEAEDSDIFDVLEHIAYSKKPIQRSTRVANAEDKIYSNLNSNQKEFIDFVLRVRDQAILQLLGTDFPRVIGSKNMKILKVSFFQSFLIQWLWGIQALITAIFRVF